MVVNRIFAQIKAGPMSGPSAAYDEPPESVGELDDEAPESVGELGLIFKFLKVRCGRSLY
jgi:hypothetical protein